LDYFRRERTVFWQEYNDLLSPEEAQQIFDRFNKQFNLGYTLSLQSGPIVVNQKVLGGYCWFLAKRIVVGNHTPLLFLLHELAHAIVHEYQCSFNHQTGHSFHHWKVLRSLVWMLRLEKWASPDRRNRWF